MMATGAPPSPARPRPAVHTLRLWPVQRRVPVLAVGLLTIGAFILRALPIDATSLWTDEIAQATAASKPSLRSMIDEIRSHIGAAPLDYFGTRLSMALVPDPTVGPRVWPLLVGTAAIPIAYAAGTAWFGRAAGVGAAILIAVAPYHVYFSTEGRFYALAVTLALTYWWMLGRRRWVLATVVAAAGMLTVYAFGLLWLAGLGMVALARDWKRLPIMGLAVVPAALWYLTSSYEASYSRDPGPLSHVVVDGLRTILGSGVPMRDLVVLVLIGFAGYGLWTNRHAWPLAMVVIGIFPGIWLALAQADYFWSPRYVMLALPPTLLLAAAGMAALRPAGWLAAGPLTVLLIAGTLHHDLASIREDWRALAADAAIRDADRVCAPRDRVRVIRRNLRYYAPDLQITSCRGPVRVVFPLRGTDEPLDSPHAVSFGRRLWLIDERP